MPTEDPLTVSDRAIAAPIVDGPTAGLAGQFVLLAAIAVGVGLGPVGWLIGTTYAVVTWVLLSRALRRSGMHLLGPANTVTLSRATLVGGVAALAADSIGERPPVAVLVILAAV